MRRCLHTLPRGQFSRRCRRSSQAFAWPLLPSRTGHNPSESSRLRDGTDEQMLGGKTRKLGHCGDRVLDVVVLGNPNLTAPNVAVAMRNAERHRHKWCLEFARIEE